MSEETGTRNATRFMSPVELLSIVGFSLGIAWMLVVFYWLFCFFPSDVPAIARDFVQVWIFMGTGLGFVILHFLGRNPKFNLFPLRVALIEIAIATTIPLAAFLQSEGLPLPYALVCLCAFLTGCVGSFITTCWLDICSRLRTVMFGRFTGLAFFFGVLLLVLATQSPWETLGLFGFFYAAASIALVLFANDLADANDERAHLEAVAKGWSFSKEVEPSFFMFGITFGMAFSWLFKAGDTAVLAGLASIAPGALIVLLLSSFQIRVEVTVMLRILLCVCVASCAFMPLADDAGRLVCSLLMVAAWAMFMSLNYSFVIKKSVVMRDAPLFRQAASRLAVPQLGFACGWLVIYIGTLVFGAGSESFAWIRAIVCIVLVAVFVLFFPVNDHHVMDGEPATTSGGSYLKLTEKEGFELRIEAVVERHQLTPREGDILRYLAKGRNAAYIQERLVVSPHTVKSHVYNIYKKLGVHSQQQLIDLVDLISLEEPDGQR